MTVFKRDEIIVLLGAGASVEAKVPASQGMIQKIEALLTDEWKHYRDLYNFLKSAIHYLEGLKGAFGLNNYNVEQLVNTLDDLRRGDSHPLYPFVGAWVPKLYEVAGSDLSRIAEFRSEIVRRLRDDWVQLRYVDDAAYYAGLEQFQQAYQHPLRVFSLNYDLAVEKSCTPTRIERGFNEDRQWDWRLFDESQETQRTLFLYKLHGSIDWTYGSDDNLIYVDAISQVDPDRLAIIFGTTYKLQYLDPFLFFAYELRRWTLNEARLIVAVGYGFADEHINGILRQSLNRDKDRKLLAITFEPGEGEQLATSCRDRSAAISKTLSLRNQDQVECWGCGAKEFLTSQMTLEKLAGLFPEQESLFEELPTLADSTQPTAIASEAALVGSVPIVDPDNFVAPDGDTDSTDTSGQPERAVRKVPSPKRKRSERRGMK